MQYANEIFVRADEIRIQGIFARFAKSEVYIGGLHLEWYAKIANATWISIVVNFISLKLG